MGILIDEPIVAEKRKVTKKKIDFWAQYKGLPFWLWGAPGHTKEDLYTEKRTCCFNHAVGLPLKHGLPHPLYDYEQIMFEKLFEVKHDQQDRHLWVLKAGGMGITEFLLRVMCWLATRDNFYSAAQMALITAPNIDLAIGLVRRIKRLFPAHEFDTKETLAIINGCEMTAYPSHNLDALRSLTNLSFALLDEADFFHTTEHNDARAVTERYIPKSDPFIAMVSTPDRPGGLMETIQKEPDATCVYKKMFLPYTIGLGKIYTHEEIERAKASPTFEHEYNLQYGIGIGNIWPYEILIDCVEDYDLTLREGFKVLGVDPAYGSSQFAIVGAEVRDGIIYITDAMQFNRPSPAEMTQLLIEHAPKYNKNVVVDSAHPGLITDLERAGINASPVMFNKELSDMTMRAAENAKKRRVRIHPAFKSLIQQLRSAKYNEKGHPDKKEMSLDLTDAFLMACYYCEIGDMSYCYMPSD